MSNFLQRLAATALGAAPSLEPLIPVVDPLRIRRPDTSLAEISGDQRAKTVESAPAPTPPNIVAAQTPVETEPQEPRFARVAEPPGLPLRAGPELHPPVPSDPPARAEAPLAEPPLPPPIPARPFWIDTPVESLQPAAPPRPPEAKPPTQRAEPAPAPVTAEVFRSTAVEAPLPASPRPAALDVPAPPDLRGGILQPAAQPPASPLSPPAQHRLFVPLERIAPPREEEPVRIAIDRIEVRAVTPPASREPSQPAPKRVSGLSLDDYLRKSGRQPA